MLRSVGQAISLYIFIRVRMCVCVYMWVILQLLNWYTYVLYHAIYVCGHSYIQLNYAFVLRIKFIVFLSSSFYNIFSTNLRIGENSTAKNLSKEQPTKTT